jgi:heterodisulfide reductase subunit C
MARFMDALRELARHKGVTPADPDSATFHKAFLNQIRSHGRAWEMGMVRDYKLATFHLMQDVDVAPTMFLKGKLAIMPHNVKGRETIRRIFDHLEDES